jgi:hypothetical protein
MLATCITWEGQPIWLIIAYFPNKLKGTKATVSNLILVGDFSSTETFSFFDIQGPLPPLHTKNANMDAVQTLLNKWKFKDLWTWEDN